MLWNVLRRPWFSLLLGHSLLCRGLVASIAVLGLASLLGLPLFPCFFALHTGLPCPGCGMTRAISALLQGQWQTALRLHPLAPAWLLLGGLMTLCAITPARSRQRIVRAVHTVERRTLFATLIVTATLVYGLLRISGQIADHTSTKPPVWLRLRPVSQDPTPHELPSNDP